jgi:hypothetical protein
VKFALIGMLEGIVGLGVRHAVDSPANVRIRNGAIVIRCTHLPDSNQQSKTSSILRSVPLPCFEGISI